MILKKLDFNWKQIVFAAILILPFALLHFAARLFFALLVFGLAKILTSYGAYTLFWILQAALVVVPVYGMVRKKVAYPYIISYVLAFVLSFAAGPMD